MKNYLSKQLVLVFVLSLVSLCSFSQRLNGIRVDSPDCEIVVYLDKQKMCDPVNSLFVSNLRAGNYRVEAYTIDRRDPRRREVCVLSEFVKYRGVGVVSLFVDNGHGGGGHDNGYDYDHGEQFIPRAVSNEVFVSFLSSVKKESFDDDRTSKIATAVKTGAYFTTNQARQLANLYSFDDSKLSMLKSIYPFIVDKDKSFLLIDVFSFTDSKDKMRRFIEAYVDDLGR